MNTNEQGESTPLSQPRAIRWTRTHANEYRAIGAVHYTIERMRDGSRVVYVATVEGSTPEPFTSLRQAKASLLAFDRMCLANLPAHD